MRARGDDPTGGPSPAAEGWSALSLRVPAALGEELLARFADESLGAWAEDEGGERVRLRIYFRTSAEAESARDAAGRRLRRAGPADRAASELRLFDVPDERWLERYQESLRPFPLAGRFLVCPSGEAAPAGGRIALRLVPGRAFGTGEHPTTRLCAAFLEQRVRAGERWVDLGCGSGILSLVAAACGAGEVLAVDVDPVAVEVAREVLAANGAEGKVGLRRGSTEGLPRGRDGIVANILASFFEERASDVAQLLRPGGTLLASGFDAGQLPDVERHLARAGLAVEERAALGEWRAVACRRSRTGNR